MRFDLRLSLVLLAACLGWGMLALPAAAQTLTLPKSEVSPAAKITVTLGADDNQNTTVDLKAKHLAEPTDLHPQHHYYVVWVQALNPRGMQRPERKGLLHVDHDLNGEIKFLTPAHRFDILITAEEQPTPEAPSGTLIVRGRVTRAH